MMSESESIFVDTNILVYAYDVDEVERHPIAKAVIQGCFRGERRLAISNQIIAEFARVMLHKPPPRMDKETVHGIIQEIVSSESWTKLNYSISSVQRAVETAESENPFWDSIIAQTMLENGIAKIYTENTKDFSKIKGIKAVNPFK